MFECILYGDKKIIISVEKLNIGYLYMAIIVHELVFSWAHPHREQETITEMKKIIWFLLTCNGLLPETQVFTWSSIFEVKAPGHEVICVDPTSRSVKSFLDD